MRAMTGDKGVLGHVRSGATWIAVAAVLAALATHPQPGFAKTRNQGAKVSIVATTGMLEGELIGVRKDAIVVMGLQGPEAVPLSEIYSVKIVKRSPTLGLGLVGLGVGTVVGSLAAPRIKEDDSLWTGLDKAFKGVGVITLGALVGTAAGITSALVIGKDKEVVLKGKTEGQVAASLEHLKKYARVPDYR